MSRIGIVVDCDPYLPTAPQFGTHVIRGLIVKFNNHRLKVYHLRVFLGPISLNIRHKKTGTCARFSVCAQHVKHQIQFSSSSF